MEILKGKNKLKSITAHDIAYEGVDNSNKVYFQTPTDETIPNTFLQDAAKSMEAVQGNEAAIRAGYNNSITTLDPRYTSLTPLTSYIVRLHILEDQVKKIGESSLILPTNSWARKQTNAGTIGDKIIDPFRFKSTAVIVAVPAYEKELQPGMTVHIVKPRPIVDGDSIMGYTNEYVHPDYNDPQVPQTPTDVDFGYAIISRQEIKVIVR